MFERQMFKSYPLFRATVLVVLPTIVVACSDDEPGSEQGDSMESTNGSNSGPTGTGSTSGSGSSSTTGETNGEVTTGDLTITSEETSADSTSASTSGEETSTSNSGDSSTGSESTTDDESSSDGDSSNESTTDGGDDFNMDDPPGTLAFVGGGDDHPCEFKSWRLTDVDYGGGDTTKMRVEALIDLASTQCDTEEITMDVIGMDYFFVSMFPEATLVIDNATMEGINSYKATAQLNLHGMTADVPIDFEFVSLMSPTRFKGTGTVKRKVFGVGPEGGPPDDVDISFDFVLKK